MTFRTDLEAEVQRAEDEILRITSQRVAGATLRRIGPIEVGPSSLGPSWSCWIVTETDAEKESLVGDEKFLASVLEASAQAGMPPDSITVQSQQTVDRDFEGSWFYAMR